MGGKRYRWPLRARFAAGLAAVLLPFIAAAALGLFYLLPALTQPLEEIVAEVADELGPLRHLQIALLTAGLAAQNRGHRAELADASRRVDAAFARVRAAPFTEASERALIASAWREWEQGRSASASDVLAFAYHAESTTAILDGIYAPARRDIERARAEAREAMMKSVGITLAAFVLALAISLYAGMRFASPVLTDVEMLRRGALRLAHGELSHRVEASQSDEFSELATAFNAMAKRIEADQATLAELATRDGLTGLLNRREFLRLLREEIERSRRYGHSYALLLLDIDRFKAVNDTWGHPAGDAVLRSVAERITGELRPSDRAARYGGEEFAVLLPETALAGALSAAERIRAAIGATPITVTPERAIQVTASVGVAPHPGAGAAEESLVAAADKALYAAKEAGRNRVVASDTF